MLRNNITPRAHCPLVTYGVAPPGESGARPASTEWLGPDRRGLVTAASAIAIATLTLTVSGSHFGYFGFAPAEPRSTVNFTVESDKIMAESLAFEAGALDASNDHQSLSHSANVPTPSEQPSGQLTTNRSEIIFGDFDPLVAKDAENNQSFIEVKKEKSGNELFRAEIDIAEAEDFLIEKIDSGSLVGDRNTGFFKDDASLPSYGKLIMTDGVLIEDQKALVSLNNPGELTETTSRLLHSPSEPELSAINPAVAALDDMDAELGETERKTTVHDPAAGDEETQSLAIPNELVGSAVVLSLPVPGVPGKARERAGEVQREIGAAIANLKIRVGDQPASSLPPSEIHKYSEKSAEPVSAQVRYAISSTGRKISPLAVTVSDRQLVSIRLDELISLFEREMDKSLFVWLKSSSNANKFVTPELLRKSGIAVDYDDITRQLILSIAE